MMRTATATTTTTTTGPTTRPWLKEIGATITYPPIAPIDQFDDRPCVTTLINEHQTYIHKVREELIKNEPLFDVQLHDDLWILRFVLSHRKNTSSAVKAAKYTLAFRKEHSLDETDVRHRKISENDALQRYMKYVHEDAIRFVIPDIQRTVIIYIDIGGVNQHGLVTHVNENDWLPSYLHYNEMAYQWIDYITRKTGRLTKLIRIIDGQNIQLSTINIECCRRDGMVMKQTELCYPQLVVGMYVCDAPSYIHILYRTIIRPLLPKRVVEKFDFITPHTNYKDYQRCLLSHINNDHIPSRYGGLYKQWPVRMDLPTL